MSLLVHELLIGTGGGRGSSLQASPSASVPLASVTHSNGSVQVSQLQSNRVVTITSGHSRITSSEKGSRLADALAGNPPYSYSSSHYFPRASQTFQRQPVSQVVISPNVLVGQGTNGQSQRSNLRQSYVLPFVLQDHNYGAPPPATPPHSPPPSSVIPHNFKAQHVSPAKGSINPKSLFVNGQTNNSVRKIVSEQSIVTLNNVGSVQISSTSNGTIIGSTNSTVSSQFMATMPLHRQQFMPHPKAAVFPSPHIPNPPKGSDSSNHHSASPDTDEESRLSDRSSSAGPSGEETETAPEGEGEDVQSDDSITRCICNFTHDDGYMIQCDRCFVWQHVDCMDIDRNNIPEEYLCEACLPRSTDKNRARNLQVKRRQDIRVHLSRVSSSDSDDDRGSASNNKLPGGTSNKNQDRKVFKKRKQKPAKENKKTRRLSGLGKNSLSFPVINGPSSDESTSFTKTRRRQSTGNSSIIPSMEDNSNNNNTSTMDQLRSWIEDYEIAVTNHYSPELRARVHSARINGISPEFRESTQGAMLGHRCRVAPSYNVNAQTFEHKVLVATTRLSPDTAIIEYQGKYTLKSQWNAVLIPPGLSYLPFVLQYNMQKEGLNVCIDARTYGNDARFARRSATFNAEIRHVVERGSVHLFIVASTEIEEEEEIILSLETAICQPNSKVVKSPPPPPPPEPPKEVEVENIKEEVFVTKPVPPPTSPIRKNGALQSKKCSRKPLLALSLPQPLNRVSRRSMSGDEEVVPQLKQRRASGCGRSPAKSPMKSPCKSPHKDDAESGGDSSEIHKMTREERKIAAYMKAFERMERAAQRKEKRKGEVRKNSDDEDDESRNESWEEKSHKKGKKTGKSSPQKKSEMGEDFCSDNTGSASESERPKTGESTFYGSPPSGSIANSGFRFPKTKKALMNEWLNETVDPVMHYSPLGEVASGVPTCYMRSPSTPRRGQGVAATSNCQTGVDMFGRSAKKRWLRQAIIDETEPQSLNSSFCSSPNSRPDSPTNDYITPLKKRRLARESMSSEQSNTPPSTPAHSSLEEDKFNEEMELDHNFSGVGLEDCKEDKSAILLPSEDVVADDKSTDDHSLEHQKNIKYENLDSPKVLSETPSSVKKTKKNRKESNSVAKKLSKKRKSKDTQIKEEVESNSCNEMDEHIKIKLAEDLQNLVTEGTVKRGTATSPRSTCDLVKQESDLGETGLDSKKLNSYQDISPYLIKDASPDKVSVDLKKEPKEDKDAACQLKEPPCENKPMFLKKELTTDELVASVKIEEGLSNKMEEEVSFKELTRLGKDKSSVSKVSTLVETDAMKDTTSIQHSNLLDPCLKSVSVISPEDSPPVIDNKDSTDDLSQISVGIEVSRKEKEVLITDDDDKTNENESRVSVISENPFRQSSTNSSINDQVNTSTGQPDVIDIKENSPDPISVIKPSYSDTRPPIKPAPIKRKLSILEYRKRKSVSCERDPSLQEKLKDSIVDSERLDKPSSPLQPPKVMEAPLLPVVEDFLPSVVTDGSICSYKSSHVDLPEAEEECVPAPKWNDEPTLLEKQRENLTARLRKEFGLSIPDKDNIVPDTTFDLEEKTINAKLADIEKRLSLSEKIKTTAISLSVTPPSFPKMKLSDQFVPKTDHD